MTFDKIKMYRCVKCGQLFSEVSRAHAHYLENGIDMTTVEMPRYTEGHFYEEIYFTTDMKFENITVGPGWYTYK